MIVRGIIFDINGTLINISTDEGNEQIYRSISHFLKYHGITANRNEVREEYYQIMGRVVQSVLAAHKGRVDGKRVSDAVKARLAS